MYKREEWAWTTTLAVIICLTILGAIALIRGGLLVSSARSGQWHEDNNAHEERMHQLRREDRLAEWERKQKATKEKE